MQNLKELLSTDISCNNRTKPTVTIDTPTTNNVHRNDWEADNLFAQLSDLVNERFRAWYISNFYRLGRDRVLQLASIARADGRNKPAYFSRLLKDATR